VNIVNAKDSRTGWQDLCHLHSFFLALAREFAIETRELETNATETPEATAAARQWLTDLDQRVQIHQLRQFVQTSPLADEAVLRALLSFELEKQPRTNEVRDKVDFLLVQLFSLAAPPDLSGPSLSLVEAAKVLQPVLGKVDISSADWLAPVENLLGKAYRAKNLNELFTARIIEQGRQLKVSAADKFFDPESMVAFARFGFLVRRAFFRLMHQDLNLILDGLRDLETQGVTTLDCRKAQFAADEPIARLRMICQSWKVMFHAEYSSGQPLCILVDLRTAVESALAHSARRGGAKAAAAGSHKDFEVSSSSWDGDPS
jgi:hypothetical protein